MFEKTKDSKTKFLNKVKQNKTKREETSKTQTSAINLQKYIRAFLQSLRYASPEYPLMIRQVSPCHVAFL